ncbi:MAG: hypothetical protein O3B21_07525 [Proteobacteria bacterium]|nr:hypothetical protein [Pseudomonadota bacterium]MDA1356274.1 hypothetical protein [Pseudomonadota bacterium]
MKSRRSTRSAIISAAAALSMLLVVSGESAAKSDEDLTGLRGIRWGMSVTDAIALFGRSVLIQQTKTSISGCIVQYAIPIRLLDEDWFIWLCEAPEEAIVTALNIETANRHTEHFDVFLEAFVEAYGPAHSFWHSCHNVNWNKTVQYDWYFPDLRISLVDRDEPANWVVMRYEPPSDKVEYGPGVCVEPPLDLRRDTAPG